MAATMKALHWSKQRGSVAYIDAPAPVKPSGPNKVIVKIAYAGVCGTDLHIMSGEFMGNEDNIMGHEMSGVVFATGQEVQNCKPGDRVIVDPSPYCGKCKPCLRGKINCCQKEALAGNYGIFRPGGWAEYCELPDSQVYTIPDSLDLAPAVLCEPYSCVLNGYARCGQIPDDANILLMGAGIIGLLWASLFHYKGHRDITMVEISPERLKVASNLGFGYTVCHTDEVKAKMDALTPEIDGFDLIVDCTGDAKAAEVAFPWLSRGGVYNIFGCCPKLSEMTLRPAEFMLREATITGTLICSFNYLKTVALVNNTADQYLHYERLGIKVYNMAQYEEAFAALRSGKICKAVFKIGD